MIYIERFVYEEELCGQPERVEDVFLMSDGTVRWAYLDAKQDSVSEYERVLFKMTNYGFVDEYAERECKYGAIAGPFYKEIGKQTAINCHERDSMYMREGSMLISYEFHVVER